MIGSSLIEKPHFYDNLCNKLKNGEEVEMIDGMIRSVLSYEDVAKVFFKLMNLKSELPYVINIAGDKAYSKYEVGQIIAQKNCLNTSLIKKSVKQRAVNSLKIKEPHNLL